jgi:hypothetical protein
VADMTQEGEKLRVVVTMVTAFVRLLYGATSS